MIIHKLYMLWGLLGNILIILSVIANYHRRRVFFELWFGYITNRIRKIYIPYAIMQGIYLTIAYSAFILALSDIYFGTYITEEVLQESDVVFVVDVSNSMLAQDIQPSRLQFAKQIIYDTVQELHGIRFGIVIFKGSASTYVPLTYTRNQILQKLQYIEPSILSSSSSALSTGIIAGINAFPQHIDTQKIMILLTDGESDDYQHMQEIGLLLQKQHIRLYTIGLGLENGAKIPYNSGEYMKDANGVFVRSQLNVQGLQLISRLSNGLYVSSLEYNVIDLIDFIGNNSNTDMVEKVQTFEQAKPQYQIFVIITLIALLFYIYSGMYIEQQVTRIINTMELPHV